MILQCSEQLLRDYMHVVYRATEISAIIPADHPNVQDTL